MQQEEKEPQQPSGDESSFWETGPQKGAWAEQSAPAHKKNIGKRICAVVLAVILLGVGGLVGWLATYYSTDPRIRELQWMLEVLDSEHYQDVDVDEVYADIYDAVMPDIFSHYYTADEYDVIIEQSQGVNRGIGISVAEEADGTALLYTVVENSPAQLAGMKKGMYLLGYSEVGAAMQTGTVDEIMAFISAQEGEFCLYAGFDKDAASAGMYTVQREVYHAAYCVYRDSETSYALRDDPEREDYVVFTETYDPLEGLDDSTAYIRLDSFDGLCADEFAFCMETMKERGRTDLILDLRGNGGGYLRHAVHVHLAPGRRVPAHRRAHLLAGQRQVHPRDGRARERRRKRRRGALSARRDGRHAGSGAGKRLLLTGRTAQIFLQYTHIGRRGLRRLFFCPRRRGTLCLRRRGRIGARGPSLRRRAGILRWLRPARLRRGLSLRRLHGKDRGNEVAVFAVKFQELVQR